MNDASPSPQPSRALASMVGDHLALATSASVTLLIAFKVLATANFDVNTALVLVQIAGTSNVLVGSLVSMLPVLVLVAFQELFFRSFNWMRQRTAVERSAILMTTTPLLVYVLAIVPVALLLAPVVLILVLIGVARLATRRDNRTVEQIEADRPSSIERGAVGAFIYVYLFLVGAAAPWLPTEAVEDVDGTRVTAYVVGTRGDETAILPRTGNDGVRMLPTVTLEREYCSSESWATRTVLEMLRDDPYSDCP